MNTLKTEMHSTLREDVNAMLIEMTCPVYKFSMRSCVTAMVIFIEHSSNVPSNQIWYY